MKGEAGGGGGEGELTWKILDFLWNQEGLVYEMFRYWNKKFSETHHKRFPLRNVSVLWDKTISMENRDTYPLSYPSHFSIPETFSDTEGFLYESFRYSEAINGKSGYTPLMHKIFRYRIFFETQKCSPMIFSGTVRQKLSTENRFCIKYRNQKWNWCLWKPWKINSKQYSRF